MFEQRYCYNFRALEPSLIIMISEYCSVNF